MTGVFQHGVASGDPLPDRVILWTRVTVQETDCDVAWSIATDREMQAIVGSGSVTTDADSDFTVKVDAGGLDPYTDYFYRFEAGGERSPIGHTRTLPSGEVENVRFAMYSCAKYSAGYFNGYGRMAERDDLDFVLCLGDYIYEYSNADKGLGEKIGRAFEPDNECRTLEDYRTRYAQYHRDPDTQAMHLTHPLIAIVDDHEMCNDTWRDGAGKHDPDEDGPWEERKNAALQAWREWVPVRVARDEPIYRTFPLGDLAELILLDTRTQRDVQADPPEADREDRTMLGKEQFDWFTGRLTDSDQVWRLIGQGVLICQIYSDYIPDKDQDDLSELGVLTSKEHGPEADQWDGYPAERTRLLEHITDNDIRDAVFLSGDVHSTWVADLEFDPHDERTDPVAVEFSVTSLTSENLDDEMGWEPRTRSVEVEQHLYDMNPHVRWCEFDSHGYTVVDVTRQRVHAEWWYVDEIHERHPGEHLGGAWQVDQGTHVARRADAPLGGRGPSTS